MQHCRFRVLLIAATFLVNVGTRADDAVRSTLSAPAIAAVDAAAQAEIEKQQLVGLAIGIIKDGQIAYLKGYGWADRENEMPATHQTVFNWASNSKPLAAVAAFQLVEQKKLDLDADVRTYVPEFPDKGVAITTRQLLCHQSGIPHYSNGQVIPTDAQYDTPLPFLDPVNCLNKFNRSPLIFPPGTKASYSTHAYILLSAVIQRAGGEPYGDQLRKRIIEPLGLTSLQLDLETNGQAQWATGYVRNRDRQVVRASEEAHYWKHGGGGYKSDVADFARWAAGLINHRLVTAESERLMWTRQRTSEGRESTFGLGFVPYSKEFGQLLGHGGSQPEAKTVLAINPTTRFGIVVMSNCNHCRPTQVAAALATACGQDFSALTAP